MIDYSFHLMVSELNDKVLGELPEIIENEGITSLKVFMAYKNTFQADDGTLFKTLQAAKKKVHSLWCMRRMEMSLNIL